MANRRFEMYQYRQVIHRMRMGQTDRAIAKTKLMGRLKCAQVRAIAEQNGWLGDIPLPDDQALAQMFEKKTPNPTQDSLCLPYRRADRKVVRRRYLRNHHTPGAGGAVRFYRQLFFGSPIAAETTQGKPEVTCMLDFAPAEAAQVDFGKGPTIIDAYTGEQIKTWIFVMTLCFSRHMYAEIVTDQKVATWLACHRRAFEFFNGVPHKLIIDNAKCAITRACFRDPEVQRSYGELAEGYGFLISPCPPRDPAEKRTRRVRCQVRQKQLRTPSSVPIPDRCQCAAEAMADGDRRQSHPRHHPAKALDPVCRDRKAHAAALAGCAAATGRMDPGKTARQLSCPVRKVLLLGTVPAGASEPLAQGHRQYRQDFITIWTLVAVHPRLKKSGLKSTVDEHLPPEALAYKMQDPQWCLKQAEGIGPHCHRFIRQLFADRVLDNLRAAQGVIGLSKKYGTSRLGSRLQTGAFL